MPAPRVSVLIVAKANSSHLQACLASLSSGISFETIVVLNGADLTPESPPSRPGVQFIPSQLDLGLAGALNRARAQASGEFLLVLHDDTLPQPGWLDPLVACAEKDPKVGAVGSLIVNLDGTIQSAGCDVLADCTTRLRTDQPDGPVEVDQCSSSCLLIRAAIWDEFGGADERYFPTYYVDVDLACAIRARGYRLLCEPRSVVAHHKGVSTKPLYARWLLPRNRALFQEKWGDPTVLPEPIPAQQRAADPAAQEASIRRRAAQTAADYAASPFPELESAQEARDWLIGQLADRDAALYAAAEGESWLRAQLAEQAGELARLQAHIDWLEAQISR